MAISAALYFSRNEAPPLYPLDIAAFAVIGAMLWWFFTPSRASALDDASGHQQPRESFAFRLGKHRKPRLWCKLQRRTGTVQ
jgi:hypothetical protein